METTKLPPLQELFRKSFWIYKHRFSTIVMLGLIPFANFAIISMLMDVFGEPKDSAPFGVKVIIVLLTLVSVLINLWVHIAFFYLLKMNADAKSLLAFAWRKMLPFSWVVFLTGIICALGFLALLIPGIIFSIWFSLSLYAFVFEKKRGMGALYHSKELVKGYWWPVFGRVFLFGIISVLVGTIPVFGPIINIFFFMPLTVIYGFFIYEDLKRAKA